MRCDDGDSSPDSRLTLDAPRIGTKQTKPREREQTGVHGQPAPRGVAGLKDSLWSFKNRRWSHLGCHLATSSMTATPMTERAKNASLFLSAALLLLLLLLLPAAVASGQTAGRVVDDCRFITGRVQGRANRASGNTDGEADGAMGAGEWW